MSNATDVPTATADAMLRRCALTLHAIGSQDRQWLLQRLPALRRRQLEALLGELQTLGIPADPRVAQVALDQGDRDLAALQPQGHRGDDAVALVRSAPAADLAVLLQDEPTAMIMRVVGVLGLDANGILSHLGPAKRRQVGEQMPASAARADSGGSVSPFTRALIEELSARLKARAHSGATEPARRGPPRWLPRWPRWKRARHEG